MVLKIIKIIKIIRIIKIIIIIMITIVSIVRPVKEIFASLEGVRSAKLLKTSVSDTVPASSQRFYLLFS